MSITLVPVATAPEIESRKSLAARVFRDTTPPSKPEVDRVARVIHSIENYPAGGPLWTLAMLRKICSGAVTMEAIEFLLAYLQIKPAQVLGEQSYYRGDMYAFSALLSDSTTEWYADFCRWMRKRDIEAQRAAIIRDRLAGMNGKPPEFAGESADVITVLGWPPEDIKAAPNRSPEDQMAGGGWSGPHNRALLIA